MSGRHKFSELEARMAPQRRARIGLLAEKLGAEIDRRSAGEPPLAEAVLRLLRDHPYGLTSRQIREKLGMSGNKAGVQAISHVLAALTQDKKVSASEQKYRANQ